MEERDYKPLLAYKLQLVQMCVLIGKSRICIVFEIYHLRYQCTLVNISLLSLTPNISHLKISGRLRNFYPLFKVHHVGLLEIHILIVLPIFEDEAADSLWTCTLCCFLSSKNSFVITLVLLPNFSFETGWG